MTVQPTSPLRLYFQRQEAPVTKIRLFFVTGFTPRRSNESGIKFSAPLPQMYIIARRLMAELDISLEPIEPFTASRFFDCFLVSQKTPRFDCFFQTGPSQPHNLETLKKQADGTKILSEPGPFCKRL